MSRTKLRTLAAPLALALLVVACGQKPGVYVEGGPLAGGPGGQVDEGMGGDASGAGFDDGLGIETEGEFDLDAGGGSTDGAGGGSGGSGGADGGGSGSPGGGSGGGGDGGATAGGDGDGDGNGGGQGQGAQEPQGSDRTGVTDDTITLAIHAPVTGASPLPSQSFQQAGDLYWRWITEEKGEEVLGRSNVEVVFADDTFEPSAARQVCRQLADRAFLLVGGGGDSSIQACAQLAGQLQVPYFSTGVTEAGLDGNPWYFPSSMTYPQQAPLLVDYVASNFPGATVGGVAMSSPTVDGALEAVARAVQDRGVDYYPALRAPQGDTSWYAGYANELANAGVEVVAMAVTPLDYIRFAQVARDQGHDFQYVGVGITSGLNAVLGSGCPAVGNGIFFSPFPALETIDDLDPEFRRAAAAFGAPNDDQALALWGLAKSQHQLFKRYEERLGTDLTREDFRAVVESAGTVENGIFPPVNFSPDVDFGGTGVHVLEADCDSGEYRDGGTFKSSF